MSRTARALNVDLVASAEQRVREAADELELAKAEETEAIKAFDADPAKASAAGRATRSRERATRLHAARSDELRAAVAAAGEAQREADRLEMQRAIDHAASLPSTLWPHIRELVELDRRVGEVVDTIADHFVEAEESFDRASELAERLELSHVLARSVGRPELAQAALIARIAIARDRLARDSDLVDGWIAAEAEPPHLSNARPSYDAALAVITNLEKSNA